MNKQELLQKAKRNIDERRYKAEEQCDNTLITLRTNTEYRVSERNLRQAQVNYSMCDEQRKSDLKKLLDQRKSEMMSVLTKLNVDEKHCARNTLASFVRIQDTLITQCAAAYITS